MMCAIEKDNKVGRGLGYQTFRLKNEKLHSENYLEIDIK